MRTNEEKTLVFGGSFDPPHRGHAALLAAAAARVRPDRILIVPAFQAPMKVIATATARERVALVRLGLLDKLPARWRRRTRVDRREVYAHRPVYTVETLSALAGERHFVCGQDSAAYFPSWKSPSRLKSLATWWYGVRPGTTTLPPAHFRRLPGRFPDISSTDIRSTLALGQNAGVELFPEVSAHIQKRGLYGLKLLARLKATLSVHRYEHTINVAALAEALACRHGADPNKARLAGLLHDAGRRFPPFALAAYARRRRLKVPERETLQRLNPMLLHAYVSEDLARREFGVTDSEILGAIRRHTLGDRRLGLLERVLYTADACSADRTHAGVRQTRALAFDDLDAALMRCVSEKLLCALTRGAWLHPLTISLWNRLATR